MDKGQLIYRKGGSNDLRLIELSHMNDFVGGRTNVRCMGLE